MKALTANRLTDGEVVFWNGGHWVERFADAELWAADDPAAVEAEGHGKAQGTVVVDVYLIDLVESEGWQPDLDDIRTTKIFADSAGHSARPEVLSLLLDDAPKTVMVRRSGREPGTRPGLEEMVPTSASDEE